MTKGELIDKLSMYPDTMEIVTQDRESFIHICNMSDLDADLDLLIISTEKSVGYCRNCGNYVYNERRSDVDYPYVCPTCDENMTECETFSL